MKELTLPKGFYEKLYNEIMDHGHNPESDDDKYCFMQLEFDNLCVNVCANFEVNVIDDSFSHAFGTEYAWHIEAGELEDIEVEGIWLIDGENETELTGCFDKDFFWNQFKVYGKEFNGIQIRHGDEVLVRSEHTSWHWVRRIYAYTDKRLGCHVCKRSIGARYTEEYTNILPATDGNVAAVHPW